MKNLPRAFLSHSSEDKEIVRNVASRLGRASVIYDEFEFNTGDDLAAAILNGISKSDIFILFASKKSLDRVWVKFEIDKAQKALKQQALSQVVTIIIDHDLDIKAIPDWMKSTLITRHNNVGLIVADIRRIINAKVESIRPSYFIGRGNSVSQALDLILELADSESQPPLVIYGLNGIGRRTLAKAIARDNLSYSTTLHITLRPGDLLPEMLINLSEALLPGGIKDYAKFLEEQNKKSPNILLIDILNMMKTICNSKMLPIIVDEGAISQQSGVMRSEFENLYHAIGANKEIDTIIITNRKLYSNSYNEIPSLRVPELDCSSTQSFIRIAGRDMGLTFNRSELESISTYSRGYPPAVRFALDEAKERGIQQLIENQNKLVNFSARIFLVELKGNKTITNTMEKILSLLSSYSPLPLSVIREYYNLDKEEFIKDIDRLLDLAFILPDGIHYRITEPLRDAAYRAFNGRSVIDSRIADLLDTYLRTEPDDDARLHLGNMIFRANLLSQNSNSKHAFSVGFAADLIEVAEKSYHDQDYTLAIKYGKAALNMRPDNVNVRRYVAQALIRHEQYSEAEEHIEELEQRGEAKEAFYVRGFAARRKREYHNAITAYEKSLNCGHRGVAIHRELASSYFEIGDLSKAQHHILQAEDKSPQNPYIIDLRCTIALRRGDMDAAEHALNVLERVDTTGFSDHRRSTFEQARGRPDAALEYARTANRKIPHPRFEVMGNLANCEIEAGDLPSAWSTISKIKKNFGNINHDAQIGLQCKYEIRSNNWTAAETLWNALRDKSMPVHAGLRLAILNLKAQQDNLTEDEQLEQQRLYERQNTTDEINDTRMLDLFIIK